MYRVLDLESRILQDSKLLEHYKKEGYQYIRQLHQPYNTILRVPTIGSYVRIAKEITEGDPRYFLISSYKGKKLISRYSYF